ncbi:hypothetical protein ARMSODRAFT_982504 [Armillaria solidipes]|uniref:Uncharacterized protein n=1 Tax=Armillaria solidipes TaxID=1076256 RepID=A0A2H3BAS4_9AGAR|nr:hypothetical protein ARMSODRAFT_982504 [Armillaria solidipes]
MSIAKCSYFCCLAFLLLGASPPRPVETVVNHEESIKTEKSCKQAKPLTRSDPVLLGSRLLVVLLCQAKQPALQLLTDILLEKTNYQSANKVADEDADRGIVFPISRR